MDIQVEYQVLQSIVAAQQHFLVSNNATETLSTLLRSLMSLNHYQYGFVGTFKKSKTLTLQILAEQHLELAEENTFKLTQSLTLNTKADCLFYQAYLQAKMQFVTTASAFSMQNQLPLTAPKIENMLVLPILGVNSTLAVLVLANTHSSQESEFNNALYKHQNSIAHLIYVIKMAKRENAILTKLEVSELRLLNSQKISKVGSWERDINNEMVSWSEEVFRLYDYDPTHIKASFLNELNRVHSADKEKYIKAYRLALQGNGLNIHYRVETANGQLKTLHNIAEFITDPLTKNKKLIGIIQDITGQRATESRLHKSQDNFRTVLESIPIPIIVLNAELKIEIFNAAAQSTFLYPADKMSDQPLKSIIHVEDQNELDNLASEFIESAVKTSSTKELKAIRNDGIKIPVKVTFSAIKPLDEIALGELALGEMAFVVILYDLSDIKLAEKVIKRSSKMDALGHMAGGIAHDFNNILNIVSGHLELLQMQQADNEIVIRKIASALKGVERGNQLTQKLGRMSRIDHNDNKLVNLTMEINDLQDLLKESVSNKIDFTFNLLPITKWILLDIGNFTDSLINLCINAGDAMPNGGTITISSHEVFINNNNTPYASLSPGHYLELTVADNGEGMPHELKEHIFDPFFTTKSKSKGTGLGLSLIYNFIKSSNGYIFVESTEAQGTTFLLYFPIVEIDDSQIDIPIKTNDEYPSLAGKRLLLVDDEKSITKLLSTFLQHYQLNIQCADQGEIALNSLKNNNFDLVLSDINMPGEIDGIKLAQKIHQNWPKLPIILMSGFIKDDRLSAPELINIPLLNKPFKKKELLDLIHEYLRQ
ncbi:hybrid sensor histidine kinase/response regulator [Algibacillus agarilyticus]|uniref:hybrid sensor histidine kinase/response regulator n=1 Tax=Algibacillus agarilyticus TaxID=2234133 RepID=UPI000DD052BF|nr:response regulator [Algibacillus agarilyticus]